MIDEGLCSGRSFGELEGCVDDPIPAVVLREDVLLVLGTLEPCREVVAFAFAAYVIVERNSRLAQVSRSTTSAREPYFEQSTLALVKSYFSVELAHL